MKKSSTPRQNSPERRAALRALAGLSAGAVTGLAGTARAEGGKLRFPGDPSDHSIVYQFNKSDAEYHDHVINSVSALLRQYGDNIRIVVSAFGPGIHILLKKPRRPVARHIREKVASLSEYGVKFHACGRTLEGLGLRDEDLLPFAARVQVGAADIMELQEQGYAYLNW